MSDKPTIFISYSRDDHKAKDFVVSHLELLEEHSELKFWHDQNMAGGDAWEAEIDRRLNDCVAAIILISRNSLTSQFILRTELKVMLERYHRDGLRIYPIVIENCLWKTYPWLAAMNVRPDRGDPLMRQTPGKRDDIMVAIGEEIADLLLGKGDQRLGGDRVAAGESFSNDAADSLPAEKVNGLSEPTFQRWGTPVFVNEPDAPSPEMQDQEPADPAPPPPALISIPKAPVWSEDLGIPVPDSFLLKPESRVVPFLPSAMGWRNEIFGWAHLQDCPLKLRLQAGAGGSGKTRLAIDVCETLASEGWFAGFLPASFEKDDVERELPKLLEGGRDCLFVIDYAETRADVVVTLARQLLIAVERMTETPASRRRFRIVMLAREGRDWFNQLAERATRTSDEALKALLTAGTTKSGPHRMSFRPIAIGDRGLIFADALKAFAARTGLSADGISPPDLAIERFDRVLMIQMAALAALRGETSRDDQDLLGNTLGHERGYWRKLLDLAPDADDGLLKTFEQSLALFTLLGGRDSDAAAKTVIARVPRLRRRGAEAELQMFEHLRRFYPNRREDEDVLGPGVRGLEPDLLGERLVADCLSHLGDDLLDAALDRKRGASAEDARAAFTVLARLAIQRETDKNLLRGALDRYFADWPKEIVAVAKETGGPIGDLMVDATRETNAKAQKLIVRQVKGDVPEETINLGSFGIELAKRSAEAINADRQSKRLGRGDLKKLFSALRALEDLHDRKLERREAAEVSARAVAVAEQLARTGKPDDQLQLARARINFSGRLRLVGRFSEALQQAIKAEGLARDLQGSLLNQSARNTILLSSLRNHFDALEDYGQHESALIKIKETKEVHHRIAGSMTSDARQQETNLYRRLSKAHSKLGDYEAALDAVTRAEIISRDLAEESPESYLQDRAYILAARSKNLADLGEFTSAYDDAAMSAKLYNQLAEQQPDLYADDLAHALSSLSLRCRDLRRFGQALDAARQAEFIRRDLAARQPEAYRFSWVVSLANLGEALINTEDFAEAIEVTEKAIGLLPTLEPRPGEDNQRIAPGFCRRVLAEARLGAGEPEAALVVAKEGRVNLWEAFAARPDHVAEFYVQGLATLAKCHRALGDDEAAMQVLAEGLAGVTPLFKKRPRALQREMLRLIEPLDAIPPSATAGYVTDEVRRALEKLPELPRGAAGL